MKIRLWHAVALVGAISAAVMLAEQALDRRETVATLRATPEGLLRLPVGDLAQNQVRFYRFLGTANQEVRFLVARDGSGHVQVAFDAAESDYKRKLGFRQDGEWLVNNKCETVCRLSEVNAGSSACRPVPLRHRLEGEQLVLVENDVMTGWRYFQ